jgi:hypothetical protein
MKSNEKPNPKNIFIYQYTISVHYAAADTYIVIRAG